MVVPHAVLAQVAATLEEETGKAVGVRPAGSLGGGCINPSARLETDGGEAFFLKWNPSNPPKMFQAEADGLSALRTRGPLRVPEVLGWGGEGTGLQPAWLLMEFVPRGSPGRGYGGALGEGLARLHASGAGAPRSGGATGPETPGSRARTAGRPAEVAYGWHRDNFIGSLPQANRGEARWSVFWRDRRIGPQVQLARELGYLHGGECGVLDTLMDRMEEILPQDDVHGPALLHGDLWSGNYYPDAAGVPVLIDPAVYRGEGEVDLAMMELFGSLPAGFREGYEGVRPLSPAYEGFGRDLYQLYYLLVHVNLFGQGYVGGTLTAARRVLRAT